MLDCKENDNNRIYNITNDSHLGIIAPTEIISLGGWLKYLKGLIFTKKLDLAIIGMRASGKTTFWNILLNKKPKKIATTGTEIEEQKITINNITLKVRKTRDYSGEGLYNDKTSDKILNEISSKYCILYFLKASNSKQEDWDKANEHIHTLIHDKGINSENIHLIITHVDQLTKPEDSELSLDEFRKQEITKKLSPESRLLFQVFLNLNETTTVKKEYIEEFLFKKVEPKASKKNFNQNKAE